MMTFLLRMLATTAIAESGVGVILPSGKYLTKGKKGKPSLEFHSWRTLLAIPFVPSLALGEAYARGTLIIHNGDLRDALMALMASRRRGESVAQRMAMAWVVAGMRWKEGRGQKQSRHNVHHHYDLGNRFYELFLDKDMQYSCAYFTHSTMSLDAAQEAKKTHISKKLMLKRGLSVLDIGCGWGGMGLTLAKRYAAKVMGITLSTQQQKRATERAKQAKVKGVEFALRDYRAEKKTYDRIVSVGMFEHVGRRQFANYFACLDRLLKTDGIALIHTIGSTKSSLGVDPFISKYIFPGGYIPKLSEMMKAVEATNLRVTDIEVLHDHYAETLRHWHKRFMANRDKALAMFGGTFCRIWEFYLVGCELSFRYGSLVVYQLQLTHNKEIVPITREYLYKN